MLHRMKLRNEPFLSIKSGMKKVEMRLNDEKRRRIRVGDIIEFTDVSTGETLCVKVCELAVYNDFGELYKHYDKTALGYSERETADCSDMLAYYSADEIKKYGVLAITVALL